MGGILGAVAGAGLGIATGGLSLAAMPGIMAMAGKGAALGGMFDSATGGSDASNSVNPSSTATGSTLPQIPGYMQNDYNTLYGQARTLYNTPYQPYTGEGIAGLTPDQLAAFQGTRDTQGAYQPYLDIAGIQQLQAGAGYQGGITQPELDTFMNPYQQGVIDITKRNAQTDTDTALAQLRSKQAGAGSYGGSRGALLESQMMQDNFRNQNDIQMTGSAANYNQALQAVMANRQGLMSSASGLAILAGQGQAYNYRDIGAMSAQGDQQQQLQQAMDNYSRQQFMEQRDYPQQQFNNYNTFLQSMMGKSTNQVTTNNPGSPSTASQAIGLGSMATSLFGGNSNTNGTSFGSLSAGLGSLFSGTGFGTGRDVYNTVNNPANKSVFADGGIVRFAKGSEGETVGSRMKRAMGASNPLYNEPWTSGINFSISNPDTPFEKDVASGIGKLSRYAKSITGDLKDRAYYTGMGITDIVTNPFGGKVSEYFTGEKPETLTDITSPDYYDYGQFKLNHGNRGIASTIKDTPEDVPQEYGMTPIPPKQEETAAPAKESTSASSGTSDTTSSDALPDVKAGMDFNEPLFRFGAAMMSTPGNTAHAIGIAANAYADAKDVEYKRQVELAKLAQDKSQQEITNKLNTRKIASDEALQKAQIAHLGDNEKMKIAELQAQYKLDSNEMKMFADLYKSNVAAMAENPVERTIQDIAALKSATVAPFIRTQVLTGKATDAEVQEKLSPAILKDLVKSKELTKEQAIGIANKYFPRF